MNLEKRHSLRLEAIVSECKTIPAVVEAIIGAMANPPVNHSDSDISRWRLALRLLISELIFDELCGVIPPIDGKNIEKSLGENVIRELKIAITKAVKDKLESIPPDDQEIWRGKIKGK